MYQFAESKKCALADMAKIMNRSTIYLRGLQTRFELPVRKGAAYTEQNVTSLRVVLHFRTLVIRDTAGGEGI